jgi:lysophospholipid acyltransferase (LPLAT)-like uncharacterized protein
MSDHRIDKAELDSRASATSGRRRTPLRRLYYALGLMLLRTVVRLIWASYRIEKIIGEDISEKVRTSETPYSICVWHGQLVLCTWLSDKWVRRNDFKVCYVVSPSVDGDVPSALGEGWGARVIRGSANASGAKVLRDMKRAHRDGYSIITAADGPTGPNVHFKQGVPLSAKVLNVPMVPLAFAANRAWRLRRWDNFLIPKPFARIVIAFGEPVSIPKGTAARELEPWRLEMENAVNSLTEQSNLVFAGCNDDSEDNSGDNSER